MITFAIVVVGWVFSLCLHEFSHAIVAYRGGDTSVREKGYLTFNPLKYTHPVLSIVLPIVFLMMGGIGLPGGAVYIDRSKLRSREWDTAVSLAGPAANLLFGAVLSIPFLLGWVPAHPEGPVWPAIAFLIVLQFSSVILNVIPVPPFDGFGAVAPWLPRNLREAAERSGLFGMIAVFMVLSYVEPANVFFWRGIFGFADAFGVPALMAFEGYAAFKFW